MIKKYVYQEKEYRSAYQVREAILKAENMIFGEEPEEGKTEFWAALGVTYTEEPDPEPTPEELLAQAKVERAKEVAKIKVTVDGMEFDGDETAQTRMGRTIAAAVALGVDINTYTQTWVLADNTVANPTIKQLAQALKLAGEAQTNLWTVPYTSEVKAE